MDKLSKARRSANMRRIRSKGMRPELFVRRVTHAMGYRYRLHYAALPGKPDMVFPARKKIIDVRGCFWHRHGNCSESHMPKSNADYWRPKLNRNVVRDRRNMREWRRLGWHALTIWECEIDEAADISFRIRRFLEGGQPR